MFAFKLARELTGRVEAIYQAEGSRAALDDGPEFAAAFSEAKARVRQMELRYFAEDDPLRQALLKIHAAVVLETPYNDFETH